MLMPLTVGISILLTNVIVQAFAVGLAIRYLLRTVVRHPVGASVGALREGLILSSVVMLMCAGHLVQIGLWASVFRFLGEFDSFASAFYHSTVNFTSLGYGDFVMGERWRLLGALEAGNGILMFGVSTAVFIAVISRLLEYRFKEKSSARDDV